MGHDIQRKKDSNRGRLWSSCLFSRLHVSRFLHHSVKRKHVMTLDFI